MSARVRLRESTCVRGCDARECVCARVRCARVQCASVRKITIFYFLPQTDMFKKVVTAQACKKSHFIIFRRKQTCLKKWQLRNLASMRKITFYYFSPTFVSKKVDFLCGIFLKCKQTNDRTNDRTNEWTNEPTTWLKKGIFEMLKNERTNAQTNERTSKRVS